MAAASLPVAIERAQSRVDNLRVQLERAERKLWELKQRKTITQARAEEHELIVNGVATPRERAEHYKVSIAEYLDWIYKRKALPTGTTVEANDAAE